MVALWGRSRGALPLGGSCDPFTLRAVLHIQGGDEPFTSSLAESVPEKQPGHHSLAVLGSTCHYQGPRQSMSECVPAILVLSLPFLFCFCFGLVFLGGTEV
jgi:hypothetical protein